ncbi:MAG: hypothetical protein NVSMB7_00290 [Chitinophagaceae bacterium]
MKILFICGALEPGRDGVGDYTRRLARAIQTLGHQSSIIALYDPYINEEIIAEQPSDTGWVNVLRLPVDHAKRYQRVKKWVHAFGPDCISLQFVPYAFNPRGLPFSLGHELQKLLVDKRRMHIMFHETWIGVESGLQWKRMLTAVLQQKIIRGLIKSLHPSIIHTQLPKSMDNLEKIVTGIQPLPLFSNIEVSGRAVNPDPSVLRVGFFSQAAASPPIISFLNTLCSNSKALGTRVELLFIGGEPARMKIAGDIFGKTGHFTNHIFYTGFLSPEGISAALQSCSLGITLVPRHALGKSGSVAAFLQHGIPVAAPVIQHGLDATEIGFFSKSLCSAILLTPDLKALALAGKAAMEAKNEIGLHVITKIFIEHICSQSPGN